MKGSIRDSVIDAMKDEYKRYTKKDIFLTTIMQTGARLDYGDFKKMRNEEGYKIRVRDIVPIKNELVNFICLSSGIHASTKLDTDIRTGIYRIVLENDQVLMLGCYFGWRNETYSFLMGLEETLRAIYNNQKERQLKQEVPKPGIFSIHVVEGLVGGTRKPVVIFGPVEWAFTAKPIHSVIEKIENDVQYFFDHPKEFATYGQIPFRKLFTIGPPGTGKSSINFYLAKRFSDKITTIFSTNLQDIYLAMKLAAKHKKPLLIFFDDAEHVLSQGYVSSDLLNFLSGSMTPNNPAGVLIVFTSNMTDYIEDRILKRPGRIDRIFQVGSLTGEDALSCARMYLKKVYKVRNEDGHIFEEMTGAEIQGLTQYAIITANFKKVPIDIKVIEEAKALMMGDLNKAKSMMNENSMVKRSFTGNKKVGFTTTNRPLQQIEEDRF